jgi:hypothetical protein
MRLRLIFIVCSFFFSVVQSFGATTDRLSTLIETIGGQGRLGFLPSYVWYDSHDLIFPVVEFYHEKTSEGEQKNVELYLVNVETGEAAALIVFKDIIDVSYIRGRDGNFYVDVEKSVVPGQPPTINSEYYRMLNGSRLVSAISRGEYLSNRIIPNQ